MVVKRLHHDIAMPPRRVSFPSLPVSESDLTTTINQYEPFRKTFYEVHPDMAQLNAWEVTQLRNELQVRSCDAGG